MRNNIVVAFSSAAAGALLALGLMAMDGRLSAETADSSPPKVIVDDSPLARDSKLTMSFAPIVKRVAPGTVSVFTTKTIKSRFGSGIPPMLNDPMLRRFFGFGDEDEGSTEPRSFKQQGLGSGVIVTKDGYILTNNHVVEGADEVKVALENSQAEYTAKVVGTDPRTDIAVLKIDAKDLPVATLGDSSHLEVGDVVLAIGNPFGVGQTVTMGIISATRRGGMHIGDYEDFIQTDAAVNPGNSGGALVDGQGRLIGINTAILSRTGGNQGVGFAIPINLARFVMEQLITKGKVERGFLGVNIQDVTPELASAFETTAGKGALVSGVTEGSAADAAGLKSGDIIVELNGKPVEDSRNLKLMVGRMAPKQKVDLKVLRKGKTRTLEATLKETPREMQMARLPGEGSRQSAEDTGALQGVEVADITPALRNQYNIPRDVNGAIIVSVAPDSASYDAGLRQGDVIQEIEKQPVTSAEEAVDASNDVKDKKVLVRIWSGGGSRYLVVDESQEKEKK